jgi:SAM-dependent methyltransferase
MEASTAERLVRLNQEFYDHFAGKFSATRQRLQPGVRKILEQIETGQSILDIGCGNGGVWQALGRQEWRGSYVGVDFSGRMLEIAAGAAEQVCSRHPNMREPTFLQIDLAEPGWEEALSRQRYDVILAFAVLHHIPGKLLHKRLLQGVWELLEERGRFIFSVWQFLNSPKLRSRIQDWERIGLRAEQVDKGDYLLDWREGGFGLRYAHQFDEEELAILAKETGFSLREAFNSDGKSGNLGLYQTWESLSEL